MFNLRKLKSQTMKKLMLLLAVAATFSSCTSLNKTMREPNARMQWEKSDFEYSGMVKATATSTRIFGIDFSRLFDVETGNVERDGAAAAISSIPVIGGFITDRTSNYALSELMKSNPGYDVVFYPSFTTTKKAPIGIPIFTKTTVEVQARLAKIK
jgi:hypothetical protein